MYKWTNGLHLEFYDNSECTDVHNDDVIFIEHPQSHDKENENIINKESRSSFGTDQLIFQEGCITNEVCTSSPINIDIKEIMSNKQLCQNNSEIDELSVKIPCSSPLPHNGNSTLRTLNTVSTSNENSNFSRVIKVKDIQVDLEDKRSQKQKCNNVTTKKIKVQKKLLKESGIYSYMNYYLDNQYFYRIRCLQYFLFY